MAVRSSAPERRVGLFVEGVSLLTPRGRDSLQELWRQLCATVSSFPAGHVDVYGFTKAQLVNMSTPRHASFGAGNLRLDIFIEQKHRSSSFDTLVVAFDAHPANQAIKVVSRSPCLRLERDFLLEQFAASRFLPQPFRVAALELLKYYQGSRGQPRAATRPPRGDVEVVYMEPMFESMVLQDERALREVFGLKRTPKAWPGLPFAGPRPDFALRGIVDGLRKRGPRYLRVSYDAAKHAWALEVLRNASRASAIWKHPIADRVQKSLLLDPSIRSSVPPRR